MTDPILKIKNFSNKKEFSEKERNFITSNFSALALDQENENYIVVIKSLNKNMK